MKFSPGMIHCMAYMQAEVIMRIGHTRDSPTARVVTAEVVNEVTEYLVDWAIRRDTKGKSYETLSDVSQ